nr:polysaccharide biosynthesis tyrosine autokinase [uncultured Lichenicoccus sp.]
MMISEPPNQSLATFAELRARVGALQTTRSIGETLAQDAASRPGGLKWSLAALRRRWWLFAIIAVVTTAVSAVYAVVKPPSFTATTQVILDPRTSIEASFGAGGSGVDPMAVDSQVEVLKSRDIVQTVMRDLRLADDPGFAAPSRFGLMLRHKAIDRKAHEELVIETLARNLDVHSLGLSSVISVSYRDLSADRAARIANGFATAYIAGQMKVKADQAAQLVGWLNSRLVVLQGNAARSETALKDYQTANGLIGLQSSNGASLAQQQIAALAVDLSRASDDEAVARGKLQGSLGSARRFDSMGDTLGSPVIQDLERERNAASARLAQLNSRYGSAYPESISEQHGIADIERRRAQEVGRIRQSLLTALDIAAARTASLRTSLNDAMAAEQKANQAAGHEIELQIQANADNDVYRKSLERVKQTIAEAGTERADARVVSIATSPLRPSSIGRKVIVFGGLLLGCAFGLLTVAGMELTRGGIYNPEQLADLIRAPWLGSVPEVENSSGDSVRPGLRAIDVPLYDRVSGFAEMIRGIAATEPFMVNEQRHLVTMLTSAVTGEGKSTTAVALARTMALQGIRVLLVDCDLFRRSLTTMLAPDVSYGLVEVIEGTASLKMALQLDDVSGMHWIGIRKESGRAGTFSNPAMPQLLFELRQSFDIVLLDAAPLLATADVRYLARAADRLVLAVRWAKTRPQGLRAAMKLLDEIGVPAAGAILTRIDLRRQRRMGDSGRYSYQQQYTSYRLIGH